MNTIEEAVALADREIDAALAAAGNDSDLMKIPRDTLREIFLLQFAKTMTEYSQAMLERQQGAQLNG
ncbi:MAG TPA: hypothetical protein VGE08_17505 [Steroidobacter sp.]|uniref:hypothetical protein n=1 Tax=Steroidobacter sp. TaxID=1978227 RepID=UPI002EDACBAD